MDEYGLRIPARSDEWRKTPGKKDTRRWCKGHVGREHQPDVRLSRWPHVRQGRVCHPAPDNYLYTWGIDQHGYVCYHEVFCSACGKILHATPERCPLNPA